MERMTISLLDVCTLISAPPHAFPHLTRSIGSRHACDQGDNLNGYTWTTYDAREGGVQVLNDGYNNVKITTEFIKVPGGKHGGSWAARIKGEPINPGVYTVNSLW